MRRGIDYQNLSRDDLIYLLGVEDKAEIEEIYAEAYKTKLKYIGNQVFFRGLIEISNICRKNCYYCGIRSGNHNVHRFNLSEAEILKSARWAWEHQYASLAIQSGERDDAEFIDFVEAILLGIREFSGNDLGITLSCGEQTEETYQRWREAGASRYLLRIETSNREFYRRLHPADHDYDKRLECLGRLRRTGYQVGTGVMSGLPGQTNEHLADDIIFFKEHDIDMVGMGPWIPHFETPLGRAHPEIDNTRQLEMGLKMIALVRLYLKDVNIAATTALQALHPAGREMGLMAGANVIMPVITENEHRGDYVLYDGKPVCDENAEGFRLALDKAILKLGEKVAYGNQGNSLHWQKRVGKQHG
ncbi:MAG: [FeFe] hydrogenase H-cluster radical SAM maturase HydE [Candidatus Cloacimonetes bacterium]|nr:[FeFe] hydrogenase H-cluster radical SAM maturase HydE [Candidatus Cloacimonadota bacterium]